MEIKPFWYFVAGFVLLYVFALIVRPTGGYRPRGGGYRPSNTWLGPGGTRRMLGGIETFADGDAVFTMFGVDWCPHCVKAKPLFESLGSTVTIGDQMIQLRYVNPEQDKSAAQGYTIEGYPTFYYERMGKRVKYAGPRTKDGFLQFLQEQSA